MSLSDASARMREKGTVGKFTRESGGKKNIGKHARAVLKSSKASGTEKREANFARMARRHWKPLGKGK